MAIQAQLKDGAAPGLAHTVWEWVRKNLFSTWYNILISVVLLWLIGNTVANFVSWALTTQGWVAPQANLKLLLTWTYPLEETWRTQFIVLLTAALLGLSAGIWPTVGRLVATPFGVLFALLVIPALGLPEIEGIVGLPAWQVLAISAGLIFLGMPLGSRVAQQLRWPVGIAWFLLYPLAVFLLRGGLGLPIVETRLWGGMLVTLLLASTAIVVSFPLGILLALGRRSEYPIIRIFCVGYIELIRGVPLVSVLYMGSLLLPLFLPGGETIDQLVRAMVAVTLFSAAYLAEDVRGGLQSLASGQTEAARALGLNTAQTTFLITLPQALRNIVPMLVGHAISMLKDTSLVAIVGLYDLLGAAQNSIGQQQWLGIPGGVWRETFITIAVMFFVINFTMSRVSRQIERTIAQSRH